MSVVAKMRVNSITDYGESRLHDSYAGEAKPMRRLNVVMGAVTGGQNELPENEVFNKSTPVGTCDLVILNPAAAEQFQVGYEFYVRFEKAE